MYICICNAIRESELRRFAHLVDGDAEACYIAMGKRPQCGQCLDDTNVIVDEERECRFARAAA